MKLIVQKRLAANVLKCSRKRIKFDQDRLSDIKEAITKADIKVMIEDKAIIKKPARSTSRVRARKIKIQKRKGRQRGPGSKKGKKTARLSKKKKWMNQIRTIRKFLKELKEKKIISQKAFKLLYKKSKGGFFRSKRHIKLYIEEHNLAKKK